MSEFNLDKLMRIDMQTKGFEEKDIKHMVGFINFTNHERFNGLSINVEGDNALVINSMHLNPYNMQYISGKLINGNLHFSLIPTFGCPHDYKLVKGPKNIFYGVSFEVNYYVSSKIEECIPFSEFVPKEAVKLTLNYLKDEKKARILNNLLAKCFDEYFYHLGGDGKNLIELTKEENTSTILDAFAYRGRCLAKRMFDKK